MRKKSGLTIVEQAIVLVPEFEKVAGKLEQQVTLRGQSKSTLNNYIRRIALFVVHFGKLPEQIDPEEINEYLQLWPAIPARLRAAALNTWCTGCVTITACRG
ncbi:phage integrase N-terminal SAM-like domain-containing protein [Gaoshiqia sp. Z1-71]|uniref:phage integrase N-terminal SAM-like domain-containing protein n=1 Tax=Gaoshiqia hydrogeniformans TaxID=3290090 RepID=UPI003BF799CA